MIRVKLKFKYEEIVANDERVSVENLNYGGDACVADHIWGVDESTPTENVEPMEELPTGSKHPPMGLTAIKARFASSQNEVRMTAHTKSANPEDTKTKNSGLKRR